MPTTKTDPTCTCCCFSIKLMHEFVKGIRTIKAGGVTSHFAAEVESIRRTELGLLSFLKLAGEANPTRDHGRPGAGGG